MLTFQQFILEKSVSDQLQKIAIAVSVEMEDNIYISEKKYNVHNYFKLITKHDKNIEPETIPVFNYANWKVEKMISDGWDPELFYNKLEAKNRISSKVEWHKIHEGSEFVPKTVYHIDDLSELKFPVVAKPENRFAGQGIVVLDKEDDIKDHSPKDFNVFSEKIDIDQELRIYFWRGNPLVTTYRNPANEAAKSLDKEKEDRLKFGYVKVDYDELEYDLDALVKEFAEAHKDLDYYSIDIAITTDGKPYVIEMSSEPIPIYGVMGHVYKAVYEDYYGEPLSPEAQAKIDEYIKKDIETLMDSDPDRFKIK